MGHPLNLSLHHDRGVPVLDITGDLDLATASQLRTHGRDLIELALAPDLETVPRHRPAVTALVVDASDVDFVDSAGLGALIDLFKCVRAHRAGFSIAGANPPLLELLARTGLTQVIALHPSAEDAVQGATGPARPRPESEDRCANGR